MSTAQPLHTTSTKDKPVWDVKAVEGGDTFTGQVRAANAAHAIEEFAGFLALETSAFSEVSARRAQ